MGLKVAIANGNWSNPSTWNSSSLPKVGDIVASNNFTVTIDQNANISLLTNTAQTGAVTMVPTMTSATTPSGIVTSSGSYDAARADWRAFSGSGIWISPAGSTVPQWIAYEFTTPTVVDSYSFPSGWSIANMPKDFLFQGWDGSTWVTLHSVTGNTTSPYNSPSSIGNTTAYIKYRIYVTAINQTNPAGDQFVSIGQIRFSEAGSFVGTSTAGGGFILNSGITLTTTGATGLSAASTDLITFSSNGSSTINCGTGNILRPTINLTGVSTIKVTAGGTLNITGNLEPAATNGNSRNLYITTTAGAVVNVTGRVYGGNSNAIFTDVSCTLTVIGNVLGSITNGPVAGIWFGAGGTLNITGNVYGSSSFNNNGYGIYFNVGNLNITGNVYGGENQGNSDWGIQIVGIATVYITGNLFSGNSASTNNYQAINCTTASYINQVGAIYAGRNSVGFVSSNGSAINLLSGPFVCNEYGFVPFQCTRMNLIPSSTSYFEFRDETTNGAVQPGAIAPSTRLLSPSIVADNPIPANVRFGTVYSLGTQTGTLHMPHPNQVSYGIPVDNTFGNAVLSMSDIWNVQSSTLTTNGSIGQRLKNASTVESTGDQLSAFS
jgi:hypothetical protein